jgi:hypothetical protein
MSNELCGDNPRYVGRFVQADLAALCVSPGWRPERGSVGRFPALGRALLLVASFFVETFLGATCAPYSATVAAVLAWALIVWFFRFSFSAPRCRTRFITLIRLEARPN